MAVLLIVGRPFDHRLRRSNAAIDVFLMAAERVSLPGTSRLGHDGWSYIGHFCRLTISVDGELWFRRVGVERAVH